MDIVFYNPSKDWFQKFNDKTGQYGFVVSTLSVWESFQRKAKYYFCHMNKIEKTCIFLHHLRKEHFECPS